MNKRSLLQLMIKLVLCVFGSSSSLAQTSESFFPSEVGNLWQYAGDVGTNTNWRISRDSLAPDGSRILFHVYPSPFGELPRYKIDTLTNVYDSPSPQGWNHIYRLNADTGNAWTWQINGGWGWLYAITTYPVFGVPTTVKVFRLGPFHPDSGGNEYYFHERHLASTFGLILDQGEPSYMYWLRGCVISGDTFGTVVSVPTERSTLPEEIMLHQNYPNPFNPTTTIEYEVVERGIVRLKVFDQLGQQVGVLAEGIHERGRYTVRFNGSALSSGIYLFRIETQRGMIARRMILLK